MQGKLSIERMCQLASVSRAGFYRSLQEQEPGEEEWKCDPRSSKSSRSTNGATATEGLALSCGVEECS